MVLPKPEFPPLLPPGFHSVTMVEVRAKCVTGFPLSATRSKIMAGLEGVVAEVRKAGIPGSLWIDGSFVTRKIDPDDVDVVLFVPHTTLENLTPEQNNVLLWFERDELRGTHHCDAYLAPEYPRRHPLSASGQELRDYWSKQFGLSRAGESKGIAVVILSESAGGTCRD